MQVFIGYIVLAVGLTAVDLLSVAVVVDLMAVVVVVDLLMAAVVVDLMTAVVVVVDLLMTAVVVVVDLLMAAVVVDLMTAVVVDSIMATVFAAVEKVGLYFVEMGLNYSIQIRFDFYLSY